MLSPPIFPCVHTDTPDLRYLSSNFAPLHHPFTNDFNIESYHTRWSDDELDSDTPKLMQKAIDSIPEEVDVEISTNLPPRLMSETPVERPSGELVALPGQVPAIVSGKEDDNNPLDSTV